MDEWTVDRKALKMVGQMADSRARSRAEMLGPQKVVQKVDKWVLLMVVPLVGLMVAPMATLKVDMMDHSMVGLLAASKELW